MGFQLMLTGNGGEELWGWRNNGREGLEACGVVGGAAAVPGKRLGADIGLMHSLGGFGLFQQACGWGVSGGLVNFAGQRIEQYGFRVR